jgi:hypothetical protein
VVANASAGIRFNVHLESDRETVRLEGIVSKRSFSDS